MIDDPSARAFRGLEGFGSYSRRVRDRPQCRNREVVGGHRRPLQEHQSAHFNSSPKQLSAPETKELQRRDIAVTIRVHVGVAWSEIST